MKPTFEKFQEECREAVARRSAPTWRLTFDEQDFQREWYVTAYAVNFAATVMVPSANVTPTTAEDVAAHLGKMLHELKTGSA